MACRILFRNSGGQSDSIELDWDALEIGAAPECHLRVSDSGAAPVIARIELRNDYYWIWNISGDCEIDGKRFDARQLAHNDAIRCGPLWIRFIADHTPAPLRFEPPGRDPVADRTIRPPLDLSGSIVSMPSGPDASPPGRRH